MIMPRVRCCLLAVASILMPLSALSAQGAELSRLIALYRSGNVEAAATGLMALSRIAETAEQRALVEHHLGLALIQTRPAESSAVLRRSIALDPNLRPDASATNTERAAWESARAQMSVPNDVRFSPSTVIAGSGDSIAIFVDIPVVVGRPQPRIRVLLALPRGRDSAQLWTGTAGGRGSWDGTFDGELPAPGVYPLIVEVFNEPGTAPLRWRKALQIGVTPITEPLPLPPRPAPVASATLVRVPDAERRARTIRRGAIWSIAGGVVSFAASRAVPNAIDISAPNGAARIAVASVYGTGLAGALYGSTKMALALTRRHERDIVVPDESALRRQRFAEARWLADSSRISALNARRESLRVVSVQIRDR
jgi:hypothetical protein